jgi:hypothetical protein
VVVASVLLNHFMEVEVAVELVGFGTRVGEDTALVEGFGTLQWKMRVSMCSEERKERTNLENTFRSHAEETRTGLLQLDRCKRERFPMGEGG